MIQVHRLLNEIERAFLHRRHGFFHRAIRRHEDHRQRRLGATRFAQYIDSGIAGKFQIGEDHQVAPRADLLDCRISIRRFFDHVARPFEGLAQHRAQLGFILDQ